MFVHIIISAMDRGQRILHILNSASVVDPNTLNLDPDPDPGYWPNLDPDPG